MERWTLLEREFETDARTKLPLIGAEIERERESKERQRRRNSTEGVGRE